MSNASQLREASTLPTATVRNQGSVRNHSARRLPVFSDGSKWVNLVQPKTSQAVYSVLANGDLGDTAFFVANRAARIVSISEVHAVAGTSASAVTLQVYKDVNGKAVNSGTPLLKTAFNLKGTANTLQNGTLVSDTDQLFIAPGERLSVDFTGTLTTLSGVVVTVTLEYFDSEFDVSLAHIANGDLIDEAFFLAGESYEIVEISAVVGTAGTHSSAVNVQVTKDTSTNAPGAGTDLLTNNTNAGFDLKGTINTVQKGSLVSTASALVLARGDRLAVDYAGTLTAAAGVVVTATLRPLNKNRTAVILNHQVNGDAADEAFFIANKPCQVIAISEVHAVAGTDGGAVNIQVTKDTGTDAPGAGTDLLTNNANAGFNLKGTANTVQAGTLVTNDAALLLAKGDRLSVDYAGTLTTLSGVVVVVVVEYIG
jgi:hypothetical protein